MEGQNIIDQGKRIAGALHGNGEQAIPEAAEFLRIYAGEKSSFYKVISKLDPKDYWNDGIQDVARGAVVSFISFIEHGLHEGLSVERKAQIDVVSDYLFQAATLLESKEVHPAVPCVIIGASLEEFLRNWVEELDLKFGDKKPGIDVYTKLLREAEELTKQDDKDIIAWAGLRNHAAHGEWELVNDRHHIKLMSDGVNLFMRQHSR